jgi:hypothetical protein
LWKALRRISHEGTKARKKGIAGKERRRLTAFAAKICVNLRVNLLKSAGINHKMKTRKELIVKKKADQISHLSSDIVRLQILELAIQDLSGLHEIICGLNSQFSDIPDTIKIETAQPVIISLLASQLIELYKTKWGREKEQVVKQEYRNNIISNLNNWQAPDTDDDDDDCFYQTGKETVLEFDILYSEINNGY